MSPLHTVTLTSTHLSPRCLCSCTFSSRSSDAAGHESHPSTERARFQKHQRTGGVKTSLCLCPTHSTATLPSLSVAYLHFCIHTLTLCSISLSSTSSANSHHHRFVDLSSSPANPQHRITQHTQQAQPESLQGGESRGRPFSFIIPDPSCHCHCCCCWATRLNEQRWTPFLVTEGLQLRVLRRRLRTPINHLRGHPL